MSSLSILEGAEELKEYFSIPGVDLFGIVNKHGRMTECWGKKDLKLSKNKKDMFLMQVALCNSMQCDFNEEFGDVDFCITQREKTKFIFFPLSKEGIALAIIDKKTNYKTIVKRIKQMYTERMQPKSQQGGFFQK